jgi:hypothetical protein
MMTKSSRKVKSKLLSCELDRSQPDASLWNGITRDEVVLGVPFHIIITVAPFQRIEKKM